MALLKDIEIKKQGFFGSLVAKSAYIKVENVKASKEKIIADVTFTTEDKEKFQQKTYSFLPNLEGKNFIAQAYDHLKTLPEFANAIDC